MAKARATASSTPSPSSLARAIERPISGPRGAPSTQAISPLGPHSQRNSDGEPSATAPARLRRATCAAARLRRRRSIRATTSLSDGTGRPPSPAARFIGAAARPAFRSGPAAAGAASSGWSVSTKRRVSSSADREQRAATAPGRASRRPAPAPRPPGCRTAKYSSRPSGSGKRRDGARRGGAQSLVDHRAHRPGSRPSASATSGLALFDPARATRSTSCRQRTAASWRSPAGWFSTVSRRSSKRTRVPIPPDASVRRLYAMVYIALSRRCFNHPETGQFSRSTGR